MADKKHPGGRPSKYLPEYNKQVVQLCRLGATDKEIAAFFKISEATLNNWKNDYPEFFESLKKGKEESDNKVSESLFRRAIGYSHKETKVFCTGGKIITKDIVRFYPPDPVSMIFWLKNRRPDLWRDKKEFEHKGKIETSNIDEIISQVQAAINDDSTD